MINQPGIYSGVAAEAYHSDPAPEPSLSNSIAQVILDHSPWHAWHRHPRLNPNFSGDDSSRRLDLGSIAHALLLGKGKTIELIEADDYRTKDAKAKRDAARAAGLLPALSVDYERASAMVQVARRKINACRELGPMFNSTVAQSEVVALWREGERWARAMIDRTDMITVLDYKTCPNANPAAVARHLYGNGYHRQRGFYLRGLDQLDPRGAGRRRFLFLFQEIDEPFDCSIMEPSAVGATVGENEADRAIRIWQECMTTGSWPDYPSGVHRAEMPPYMEGAALERELEHRDRARYPGPMLTDLAGG